jgi:hypothetical protein
MREKLAKADVDAVAAERLAEFEQQMASIYKPSDDPAWADLHAETEKVTKEAQAKINERSRELGIPERFAPGLSVGWYGRGENQMASRRAELRKVAQTRLAANAKTAKAQIERNSIEVQTQLVASGLESAEARTFLESMPTAEALMPAVPSVLEIEAVLERRRRHGL